MKVEEKTRQYPPFPQFADGGLLKQYDNFLVVMGYKGLQTQPGRERFFILPTNEKAQLMIQSAVELHQIPTETRPVLVEGQTEQSFVSVRMDFSEDNWRDSICDDRLVLPDNDNPDTVPSIQRMEMLLKRGEITYTVADLERMDVQDLRQVVELGQTTRQLHTGTSSPQFYSLESLREWIEDENGVTTVARVNGEFAGFLLGYYMNGPNDGYLNELVVVDKFRRFRIAGQLIDNALSELEQKSQARSHRQCNHVYCLVKPDNEPMLKLLQKYGFELGETFVYIERTLPRPH